MARAKKAAARQAGKRGGIEERAKKELTHADIMRASIRIDPVLRRRSELLWEDRSPPSRGPKPSLTPNDVVHAAIAIADKDGLGALTMQNVSAKLGLTTMAVYRYFPSKEALYDAIVDAGMGSPPPPKEPREHWRTEVARVAHAKRAMLIARPWLAELPFVAAPHGPNWLSWLEAVVDPFVRTGLAPADAAQMLSIIDGYTRGASDTAISLARAQARGVSVEEWAAAVGADLGRAIGDPRFPTFAAILTTPTHGPGLSLDESFDFGLQRVLDGIELYLNSRPRS
ncbi:MAG: TetR/AcrR family transcriptional regulator [Gemmatimonadota bacterium]